MYRVDDKKKDTCELVLKLAALCAMILSRPMEPRVRRFSGVGSTQRAHAQRKVDTHAARSHRSLLLDIFFLTVKRKRELCGPLNTR